MGFLPKITVSIQNQNFSCLIDSGANCSIISPAVIERLKLQNMIKTKHIIKVANGGVMKANTGVVLDLKIGNKIKKDVKFIILQISHDILLGNNNITDLTIERSTGTVKIDDIQTVLEESGMVTQCTVIEETVLQANEITVVHIRNPVTPAIIEKEEAIYLKNVDTGFCHEHDLTILDGVYKNEEYIKIPIKNPWPFQLRIPKNAPIANGITMENTKHGLACNELIEVTHDPDHARKFKEHLEIRNRTYMPHQSEAYRQIIVGSNLSAEEKSEVTKLLKNKRSAFSTCAEDIGMINTNVFGINWHDENAEVYIKPRPCQPAYKERARNIMDQWKRMGIIEPTSSRMNVPIFFIPKKGNKEIRPVLDCRALNDETIPNRWPVPHLKDLMFDVSEMIGSNSGEKLYISQTDIQAAYNQMLIKPEDRHKCAFSWENRQYQAARCMFGLKNAPSAFCQFMANLTEGMKNTYVLLDDVLFLSTSWTEHVKLLEEFFNRCMKVGLTLKPSKTYIGMEEVDYLGFRINKDGIQPLKEKIEPIINFPQPRTKKQVQRFVGMTNFYSKFVVRGHQVLAPLYKLCGKEPFRWRPEHMDAFEAYKKLLANYVTIVHRDQNKQLVLVTDASQDGMAGALHQLNEKNELEPLGFVSRALKENEKRLASRYLEFLAITWALEQFDWELQGYKVIVMTDHQSLCKVLEEKEHKEHQPVKIINAHARLARYNTEIIHRPNTDPAIVALDAFSRAIPMKQMEFIDTDDEKADRGVSNNIAAYKNMQRQINVITRRQQANMGQQPEDPVIILNNLQYSKDAFRKMQEADDQIKIKVKNKKCKLNKNGIYVQDGFEWSQPVILVPECLGPELLSYLHIYHGHVGAEKLEEITKRNFHIKNRRQLCLNACSKCEDCIIVKPKPSSKHPHPPNPDFQLQPWSRYYTDIADFGQKDKNGNRYFLGIMCAFSRYVDGVPLPDKRNETVARGLANLLLRHNATNGKCVMDNGREFNGPTTKSLLELFNIRVSHISPYNPSGNKIERVWRELGIKARILKLDVETWSRDVYTLLYHINNTPHKALGNLTPNEILTGRPLQCPVIPKKMDSNEDFDEFQWVDFLSNWLYEIGKDLTNRNRKNYANQIPPTNRMKKLQIGSRVAYWSPQRVGDCKKLHRAFATEGRITKSLQNGAYEITTHHGSKIIRNIKYIRELPAV